MTYTQTIDYLFNSFPLYQNIGGGAYKEGLDNIVRVCRSLDNPQRNYFTIHIAGTNGKGSVAHTLASILQQAGYCTGLFTSPHLSDFRERIRVDGRMIEERQVVDFVERNRETMKGLSFFEMTAAMAFNHFSESDVEVAVIETGMGGLLDATNIITPILSIITNIGLDHTRFLGNTIAEIATQKAGIIKPEVPVVVGESNPESDPIFIDKAAACDSLLLFADREWECIDSEKMESMQRFLLRHNHSDRMQYIDLDLMGDYQRKNIQTIRTAVHVLRNMTHLNISTRALLCGCRTVAESTGLRGRWQVVSHSPLTVCDTGHNAHGFAEITAQLRTTEHKQLYMVLGFVDDKDLSAIMPLLPHDAHYIFTHASISRALSADKLAATAATYGLQGETVDKVADAVALARRLASPDDMIYIGGSTFVVAEVI